VLSEGRTRHKKQEPIAKSKREWIASSSSILESLILTGAYWRKSLPPKHGRQNCNSHNFAIFRRFGEKKMQ